MLELIFILLAVAAIAALLGLNTISGVALTGAKILIGLALLVLLLIALGIVALA